MIVLVPKECTKSRSAGAGGGISGDLRRRTLALAASAQQQTASAAAIARAQSSGPGWTHGCTRNGRADFLASSKARSELIIGWIAPDAAASVTAAHCWGIGDIVIAASPGDRRHGGRCRRGTERWVHEVQKQRRPEHRLDTSSPGELPATIRETWSMNDCITGI